MTLDDMTWRQGRRRLRDWLPTARASIEKDPPRAEFLSGVAKAQAPHVVDDNLDAVLIYPAPKGGWHADVVLKDVPPGVPNTLGTPMQHPVATREEAERRARGLLEMCLAQAKKNAEKLTPPPWPNPAFELFGWSFPIPARMIDLCLTEMPELAVPYRTRERAIQRVEAILAELAPEGFDGDLVGQWPIEKRARLLSVLTGCVLTGLYRYPPNLDEAPK